MRTCRSFTGLNLSLFCRSLNALSILLKTSYASSEAAPLQEVIYLKHTIHWKWYSCFPPREQCSCSQLPIPVCSTVPREERMASGHPKYSTSGPPQQSTHSNIVLLHCPYSSTVHLLQHLYKTERRAAKSLPCRFPVCLTFPQTHPRACHTGRAETSPSFRVIVICFMSICFTRCELEEKGLPVHLLAASRWEELHMAHPDWNNFIQHRFLLAGGAVQDTWFSLKTPRSPLHKHEQKCQSPEH